MIANIESVATHKAQKWLEDNHVVACNVVGPERRAKLRAYIGRMKTSPKPGPRDWAYVLLSRIIDGEKLPPICEQYAREVIAMESQPESEAA
jgi:hypothetical protein